MINIYKRNFNQSNSRLKAIKTILITSVAIISNNTQSFSQQISAGWSHTLYLCNNGSTANSWGANAFGQIGDGTSTDKSLPVLINSLTGISSISAGYQHTIALNGNGTVWACGDNTDGQLGNGTNTSSTSPVQVSGLTSVISISGGTAGYHSLALKSDGTVWAWGRNTDGQLGDGTNVSKNVPTQITALTGIVAISGGEYHSLAIKNDGTVWAWGRNSKGQLGNGTTTSSNVPVQVNTLTSITAIAAGRFFSIALKSDSTVWTWGENLYGQLGNGTTVDSNTPVQVSGLTDATAIAGAAFHCLVIKSDSTLVSWGRNTYGNLGNGTTTNSSTPISVSNLMSVVAIAGGTNYSVAMKANDSLFTFGRNTNGQLGDGTNTDRYLPTAVLSLCPVPTEITEYNTSESNTVFVFPNPSSNGVFHFINNNNAKKINTIEVFNMLGEKIMNTTNNNTSTGFIDLSNQANGVYLMTIKTENNVFYQKLIKQ